MGERVDCGDSGCIMPGARKRYGGQHTNGGCRCNKEDVARAHEEIAAQLRGSPSWKRDVREDKQAIEHLVEEVKRLTAERDAACGQMKTFAEANRVLANRVAYYVRFKEELHKLAAARGGDLPENAGESIELAIAAVEIQLRAHVGSVG